MPGLGAWFGYSVFNTPENEPYIETSLSVDGATVTWNKLDNGKYQSKIEVLLLLRDNDKIVNYDKYELLSPELYDTLNLDFAFTDLQRYALPTGDFELELQVKDLNKPEKTPFVVIHPLSVDFPESRVSVSDIQLVESFKPAGPDSRIAKSGYDIIPLVGNFLGRDQDKLTFYCEVYHADRSIGKDEPFLITSFITRSDRNQPIDQWSQFRRETGKSVNVLFSEMDISKLPSGNYFLVVEVKNRNNELVARNHLFFQRSNPDIKITPEELAKLNLRNTFAEQITSVDSLAEYIRCLEPISEESEKAFAQAHLQSSDLDVLQRYFYSFWVKRDPLNPEEAWMNYLNEVYKVNRAYSTRIQKGYETDRGRVYLKYGPPNSISESYNEPATYPYEIWHYYVLPNGQRNKKFVFYTKDIVTNDFILLHSDVSGELSNYRWQYVLHGRVDPGFDIDRSDVPSSWGGNAKRYYDIPR
ncbi:MAG: hypothetical protein Kow00127_01370 [Bacteroidales bacterium]